MDRLLSPQASQVVRKVLEIVEAKGLKKAKVEQDAGLWTNRLFDWEHKGGDVSATQLKGLATALGVSVECLLSEEPYTAADDRK
jgi:transcriptional regulator with XRE-family HTH domain